MAGSPGAGKTEFSKNLIKEVGPSVVRIDPDEIRDELLQYNGGNAHLFQSAVKIGVDKIYYFALKNKQNFILDGTFANFSKALENINRCLEKRDFIEIFYIYQDPLIAWDFTKKREVIEHRHIGKEIFINAFFSSKDNVNKVKQLFPNKVKLNLVIKDFKNDLESLKLNVEKIDFHLKEGYTSEELERILK